MAAPNIDPHILNAAIDNLATTLGAMGRDALYRREYGGVVRYTYGYPLEPTMDRPQVQLDLADDSDPAEETDSSLFIRTLLVVQVHVEADALEDGTWDIITPSLDVKKDIHQAVMSDRTLGLAYCSVRYVGGENEPFADSEIIGKTVTEIYEVLYECVTGDMGATI